MEEIVFNKIKKIVTPLNINQDQSRLAKANKKFIVKIFAPSVDNLTK